jgi:DNA-binding MarR family transcriptional regulator
VLILYCSFKKEEINMEAKKGLKNSHYIYNLARYIFLRTEHEYNKIVEVSGITLPQLRVLWIIKAFPGISLGEIARIGYWAPPTVTKMLRTLINKGFVEKEEHQNKKVYKLILTKAGDDCISANKQGNNLDFPLIRILNQFNDEDITFVLDLFKSFAINTNNKLMLSYIDSVEKNGFKIDYNQFNITQRKKLEDIVWFYNILRIFILKIEGEHRGLLAKYNLTYPQLRALWVIEAFPGLTSVKLSEISFWSPSTVNVIVKNLYEKDLIYKEKSHIKNSLYLYLSKKGESIIISDFRENQEKLSLFHWIENVSDEELFKINSLLKEMNKAIGNDNVEEYVRRTYDVIENSCFEYDISRCI